MQMRPKFRRRGYVEIFCRRYVLLVSGRKATLGQLPMMTRRRETNEERGLKDQTDMCGKANTKKNRRFTDRFCFDLSTDPVRIDEPGALALR